MIRILPIGSTGGFASGFCRTQPTAVFSVSGSLKELAAIFPPESVACLQLADNGRRFPFRALSSGLFLIGSGSSCDLRLGEAGVPSLHSMIRIDETGAQVVLLSDGPSLCVRGAEVACADLRDGDSLEIGEFRAIYRVLQSAGVTELSGNDELLESHLRLPDPSQPATGTSGTSVTDSIRQLESQVAQSLRQLDELRQQQRLLSENLQELQRQLEALRVDRAASGMLRASA